MKQKPNDNPAARLLNVGCGTHFHPAWCNVDLVSSNAQIIEHDIRRGLPFHDGSFGAVYHSHVLEHLTPEQGESLIRECHRVLTPGGVLRIVVPDLEQISRIYLKLLGQAWNGDQAAEENYEWMKLELLDQMVRHQSGGLMGPYMIDSSKSNAEFVRSRIGAELESCQSCSVTDETTEPGKIRGWLGQLKNQAAIRAVRLLLGSEKADALREGMFRQQGEIHRWMYDRLSLRKLCEKCGLVDFQVCQAQESSIGGFSGFQLDATGTAVRKPDSLFVECRKISIAARRAA